MTCISICSLLADLQFLVSDNCFSVCALMEFGDTILVSTILGFQIEPVQHRLFLAV